MNTARVDTKESAAAVTSTFGTRGRAGLPGRYGAAPRSLTPEQPRKGGYNEGRYWQVDDGWGQETCPCKAGMPPALEAFRTPSCGDEQGNRAANDMALTKYAIYVPEFHAKPRSRMRRIDTLRCHRVRRGLQGGLR